MPGSQTTQGPPDARNSASGGFAFRQVNNVGTLIHNAFAAPWLAYTLPYRRFADHLAEACARIGADVGSYSFIAMDFHHLLLAGLPAHIAVGTAITGRPPHRSRTRPIKASGSYLGCLTSKRTSGQG
jgi:hypothetical protein